MKCLPLVHPFRTGVRFTAAALALALPLLALPAAAAGGGKSAAARLPAAGNLAGGGGGEAAAPGEVLVKLRSTAALPGLLQRYPLMLVSRFGARPIYRLKVATLHRTQRDLANVPAVLAALALEPEVLIAEANTLHSSPEVRANMPWTIGNPTQYATQWAPGNIRLAAAHKLARGAGVRVAVLDTGFDLQHPALAGRWLAGHDFVDDDLDPSDVAGSASPGFGHGTHVAGLIALTAPDARVMPLRVLDSEGVGNAWVLAEAMLHAVDPDTNPETEDGVHIINLSLGSPVRTRILATVAHILSCRGTVPDDPIGDLTDPGYADDHTRCSRSRGAVVIGAAGNDGSRDIKQYPAAEGAYGLLAVGASTSANRIAAFSNEGSWVELSSPGEGITSSIPGGGYASWSGTSMAAPIVSGVAALLMSQEPALEPKDVVRRLTRASAAMCGTRQRKVDALAALTDQPLDKVACP
jgi:subtilisin family serine protease